MEMQIGNMIIGGTQKPQEPVGIFRSYVTQDMRVICFEEVKEENGQVYWNFPLVLEVVVNQDQETGQITKSQAFRPIVPPTKSLRFKPLSCSFLCEIEDDKMKDIYFKTVQEIRMAMSGIVKPTGRPPLPKGFMI